MLRLLTWWSNWASVYFTFSKSISILDEYKWLIIIYYKDKYAKTIILFDCSIHVQQIHARNGMMDCKSYLEYWLFDTKLEVSKRFTFIITKVELCFSLLGININLSSLFSPWNSLVKNNNNKIIHITWLFFFLKLLTL